MQSVKQVKASLPDNPTDTGSDEPCIRSFYILLSYAFELMLKSRLVALKKDINEDQLIEYKHNIGKILRTLKSLNDLKNIGINSFREEKKLYIIKPSKGKEFCIHDFTNIRYYPKEQKTQWDKPEVIKKTAETMIGISEKIGELWRGI